MNEWALAKLTSEMREDTITSIPCYETESGLVTTGACCHVYIYHPDYENDKSKWEVIAGSIDTGCSQTLTSTMVASTIGLEYLGQSSMILAVGEVNGSEYGPCCIRVARMRDRIYSKPVLVDKVSTTPDPSLGRLGALIGRDVLGHFDLEYRGPQVAQSCINRRSASEVL